MPTFKIISQVSNPDFPCVVRSELATMLFVSYNVANGDAIIPALTEEKKTYSYFRQDGATAHTSHRSMGVIHTIFTSDRVVSRCQSGLVPCGKPPGFHPGHKD
ncbi:hypothetical protein TNCV_2651861 [Trichonephila clavipes]|nr:hypothetical protein TNCV_2651861 [Trichonephila clavipes]